MGTDVFVTLVTADAGAATAVAPRGSGKFLAELNLLARRRLARMGAGRIHGGALCTHSDAVRFCSHRRDGVKGRMASLVWTV